MTKAAATIDGDLGLVGDMGDPVAIAAKLNRAEAEVGPVSAQVNNAGAAMPGDVPDYDLDTFNKVVAVHLNSVFLVTQRVAKTMIAEGLEGAIVDMSSINAQHGIPAIPAYCASKGGVMQLAKVAAIALAKHNIRVNVVRPGSIDTAMMAGVNATPEAYKTAMSRTPLGRSGTAREIRDVVAFLASKKASYVTGETIYVDGGRMGLKYTVQG